MNQRGDARHLILVCLVASVWSLTACSKLTDFVVVNASDHTIEVRYKIKEPTTPDALIPRVAPAVKDVSQLHSQTPWRELSGSQYAVDSEDRTVTTSLAPGEALRIDQADLSEGMVRVSEASQFSIEEIVLTGLDGEVELKGQEVPKGFIAESNKIHILTYQ